MFNIKTYNKISKVGLDMFDPTKYTYSDTAENADAAMVRSAALHDEVFPENLKAIARAGAGTNNIPCDRCSENGIVVFNTPGANANAVKELVIMGLFLSSRRVVSAIEWAKTLKGEGEMVGKLVEKGKSAFAGPEVKGKTLGVIGLGAIGGMVANAASRLGMKVIGFDPYLSVNAAWNITNHAVLTTDINEIYEKSDYITLHVPLNDETKGYITADTIAKMKDGVRVLNFSRGGLVNSADIISALDSGKVSSYVTDFPSDEIIGVNGVIAIPHLGASTPESEDNCATMAAEELIDYLENGNITNSVNMPNITMPRSGGARICVIHKNIPNVLNNITSITTSVGINIDNMLNKSRKDYAYTMLDIAKEGSEDIAKKIEGADGVIKVRVI